MKKMLLILGFIFAVSAIGKSQADNVSTDLKPFYSIYVKKKLNYRWSVDLYALTALKSFQHDFWLSQINLNVKYRINKPFSIALGYGYSMYKYSTWWDKHYPQEPILDSSFIGFHILNVTFRRDDNIGKWIRMSNRIIAQQFIPKFEKYETRIQYNLKFSYRKRNLPLTLKPFVQGAIYYYLNGTPINYYDENLNYVSTDAPNGFHRYRIRFGTSFKPIKSHKKFGVVLYFAVNREFNWIGNDLNVPRPSIPNGTKIFTSYQFNNYNILGLQLNYFF